MAETDWNVLVSCEHGGNLVPLEYAPLFRGAHAILATHRAYDPGMAEFASRVAAELRAPLFLAEVTRLLVDLNRSPGHPQLFSEFSRSLAESDRRVLLERYYHPYRSAVMDTVAELMKQGPLCHVSLHSFIPELRGQVRNADIGLLYDPRRAPEKRFCLTWGQKLHECGEGWRIRRNYPYRGTSDSLVTLLRRRYPVERYLGVELEVNQQWPMTAGERWERLQTLLPATLADTLADWSTRRHHGRC